MTKFSPKTYTFKGFTVDLDRACLLRAGEEIKLRPKVFEALRYLVENNSRLVTKDELIKAIWSDAFVTDDSLVQCLVELRRALGDEAQECLKTVPRRGYIFEAPVTQNPIDEPRPAAEPPQPEMKPVRSRRDVRLVALMAIGGAAAAAFLIFQLATTPPSPQLTDEDTVLIADFVNATGDRIFDGTLRQALAVQMAQTPSLNIVSEERIRETLRFMNRSPNEPVTGDIAREVAQRQGSKALLAGSISTMGSHYVIALDLLNAQNGDTIARQQVEAEGREQVLRRVGEAASRLRERLGESLASIEKYDVPVEQATTPSLEALKAFSLGREQQFSGKYFDAIPFYRRAIELDPQFAIAHAALAVALGTAQEHDLAAESSQKAFDLRERTSERERFYISSRYYMDTQWDGDKTIEVQEMWKQTYPRDFAPRTNLAVRYCAIGQFEKASEEAREAVRLNPDAGVAYSSVALSAICLNRFDDAKAALERALARKLEPPQYRYLLYSIALLQGDTAAMQQLVAKAAGTPFEAGMLAAQSVTAASSGQLLRARELTAHAIDLALRLGQKESAAQHAASNALWEASTGNCREAKNAVTKTRAMGSGRFVLGWSALALALCGESVESQSVVEELARQFPNSGFVKSHWVPITRAALELSRNNAPGAIQWLQVPARGETGTYAALWPAYLRGLAHLHQGAGAPAAVEFQKVLDHRGVLALTPGDFTPAGYTLYPLALLGLARAKALAGDTAASRRAYEGFLDLWKDADSNSPVLKRAREEYTKL